MGTGSDEEMRTTTTTTAAATTTQRITATSTPVAVGVIENPRSETETDGDALSLQNLTIQGLTNELDKERNASSSAAVEAMSMILRLQREKAEVTMEARQFKLYVEEKMAHDQRQISYLEDIIYKREEMLQSVLGQLRSYKRRLVNCGVTTTSDQLEEYEEYEEQLPESRNRKSVSFDRVYSSTGIGQGKDDYDEDDLKTLNRRMQSIEEDREALQNEFGLDWEVEKRKKNPSGSPVLPSPRWFFSSFKSVFKNTWLGVPLFVKICLLLLYRKQILRVLFIPSLQPPK